MSGPSLCPSPSPGQAELGVEPPGRQAQAHCPGGWPWLGSQPHIPHSTFVLCPFPHTLCDVTYSYLSLDRSACRRAARPLAGGGSHSHQPLPPCLTPAQPLSQERSCSAPKPTGIGSQTDPGPGCGTLGKSLNLSEPQFIICKTGNRNQNLTQL